MELGKEYILRPLNAADDISKFKTGNEAFLPLKNFLKNQAQDFHQAAIARTYVAIRLKENTSGELEEDGVVIGYISLTTSEIDIRNGYTVEDCPFANNYDSLPAIKIARLAVDSRFRNQGIGENLISLAFALTDQVSEAVGCRFLITDAKQEAIPFYERQGFTLLDTDQNKTAETPVMFVDMLKLQE